MDVYLSPTTAWFVTFALGAAAAWVAFYRMGILPDFWDGESIRRKAELVTAWILSSFAIDCFVGVLFYPMLKGGIKYSFSTGVELIGIGLLVGAFLASMIGMVVAIALWCHRYERA